MASSIRALMFRWFILALLFWALWRLVIRPSLTSTSADRRPAGWDPHAVLGIPADASAEEITRAYREQIKLYHPDRVAELGPELQKVAHEKTLEIQRAYAELSRP